jgi:hypothetical protein
MPNFFEDPIGSTVGAMLAGTSGAAQVGTWLASEFGKFGRKNGGRPGEITFAVLGAGTGAMTGFFLGSILGGLSGSLMVQYFAGNLQQAVPYPQASSGSAPRREIDSDAEVERLRAFLLATSGEVR